ncbi:MAG: type II secretion system F family protein [Fimbriimonas sp.]
MPEFKYLAKDQLGRSATGVLEAQDEMELRYLLRANDLFLTKAQGGGGKESENELMASWVPWAQPNLQDLTIAFRQLASLTHAGLSLPEALDIVKSQTPKPALQHAFEDINRGVVGGRSLSQMMRSHPKLFSPLVIALIDSGETAGTLDESLEVIADQFDKEAVLKKRIKLAMAYPKIVVLAAIGCVAGMLLFVVPVFSQVYAQFKGVLPAPTRALIGLSDLLQQTWWLMIIIAGLIVYGIRHMQGTEDGRRFIDYNILRVPLFGPLIRKLVIARFVHTLANSLRGGVPVLTALFVSASTAGNKRIEEAVVQAAQNVRDGSSMASELTRTGEFPLMVTRMLAAGEASGNVDHMLEEINRFYERDVAYAVETMTRMMEPLMTVVLGTVVLLILVALYMPIFNLARVIR